MLVDSFVENRRKLMRRESRAIYPRACGNETELGMIAPDLGLNVTAGRDFIDRFRSSTKPLGVDVEVEWDPRPRLRLSYDLVEERKHHAYLKDPLWRSGRNFLLDNGARFYLDGEQAEISSPKCLSPLMLLTWNRACYLLLDKIRAQFAADGVKYSIFRNNVAIDMEEMRRQEAHKRRRSAWGFHLNLTSARFVPGDILIRRAIPWFAGQIPLHGSGKVGCDVPGVDIDFQISQRADFMEDDANNNTMAFRPIFNTRDVAYADERRFRRVHIIPFDANMLELPDFLKTALNTIFFMALEDGIIDDRFEIYNPVAEIHKISWDLEFRNRVWRVNQRKTRNTLDCLRDYLHLFWEYLEAYWPEEWELKSAVILASLKVEKFAKKDWDGLFGWSDWVTKREVIRGVLEREGKNWQDSRAYQLDSRYHDNNHSAGLFFRKGISGHPNVMRLTSDEEVERAVTTPPPTSLKWVIEIMRRYQGQIASSTYWDRISFRRELADRTEYPTLIFNDPNIVWDEKLAEELLSLPLPEFLEAANDHLVLATSVRRFYGDMDKKEGGGSDDDDDDDRDREEMRRPHMEEDDSSPWLDAARKKAMGGEPAPRYGLTVVDQSINRGHGGAGAPHHCSQCRLHHDASGRVYMGPVSLPAVQLSLPENTEEPNADDLGPPNAS